MCLGSYEIAGVCATPLIIIILPIVGIYRLVQCIFYDIPIYLFRLTRVPTSGEAFPYGSAIRVLATGEAVPYGSAIRVLATSGEAVPYGSAIRVLATGEAFPYGSAIRVNTVKTQREVQEVRVDVQPQVLRITIPVSEDHVSEDPV